MSSQIEIGWVGWVMWSPCCCRICLSCMGKSLSRRNSVTLWRTAAEGNPGKKGQRNGGYTLEDEHGTYKSPSLKGKWSEPNLHADMFQQFIFQGVGTPFDQMHNDCWRKPYIHIILKYAHDILIYCNYWYWATEKQSQACRIYDPTVDSKGRFSRWDVYDEVRVGRWCIWAVSKWYP